jgi:hypothetical protein
MQKEFNFKRVKTRSRDKKNVADESFTFNGLLTRAISLYQIIPRKIEVSSKLNYEVSK